MSATGDRTLLHEGGAEVIFETARLWADLGDYIPSQDGAFCLNEVTGPDEYTALVNNNCYTNLMAQAHLRYAASLAGELAGDARRRSTNGSPARIGLAARRGGGVAPRRRPDARPARRRPRDPRSRTTRSSSRAPWDFAGTPASMYPLLLHYHPLVHLPPPGPQAARRRARPGAPRRASSRWPRRSATSTTTTR